MPLQNLQNLGKNEGKVLVNRFIHPNFNYCPLMWMLSSAKSIAKLTVSKKAPLLLSNNCERPYEVLLENSGKSTITLTRYRSLYIEVYKTLNNLHSPFIKYFFK